MTTIAHQMESAAVMPIILITKVIIGTKKETIGTLKVASPNHQL
jgi:hypothetical protein